jgi:hypothetical protein
VYNITATANGGTIVNSTLVDNLPSTGGLVWKVKGTDAGGGACNIDGANQLTCSFGTMLKGQSKSITVYATTFQANCSAQISSQVNYSYNDGTGLLSGSSPVSTVNVKCR